MYIQSGRSMVEMLGTLALVGVLSLTGLWGYRTATSILEANRLIEDVRTASLLVITDKFATLGDEENINDVFSPQTGYDFFAIKETDNTLIIAAEVVDKDICEAVIKQQFDWVEEILTNGEDVCEEENTIAFYLNKEMSMQKKLPEGSCRTNADCANPLICSEEFQCVCANAGEVMVDNYSTDGDVVASICCPVAGFYGKALNGTCCVNETDCLAEVAYLENLGSAYINTGVSPNNKMAVETKYAYNHTTLASGQFVFGSRTVLSSTDGFAYTLNGSTSYIYLIFSNNASPYNSTTNFRDTNTHIVKLSQAGGFIDGNQIASYADTTFSSTLNMYLFGLNQGGNLESRKLNGKIYYSKIWNNGTLIRDFIPVKDMNGVGAMLDRVENKLYRNAGSGAFTLP